MRFFLITVSMGMILAMGSGCKEQQVEVNPLLTSWDTPFGVPPFDKIRSEHYRPALVRGMEVHQLEIDSITADSAVPNFDNVIAPLDRSGALFNRVYAAFSQVNCADTDDKLQATDLEISPLVSAHFDNIYFNDKLFEKVAAVYEHRDSTKLTPEQMRLTELTYKRFVRSGALLNVRQKERLRVVNQELAALCVRFGNNVLDETQAFTLVLDNPQDVRMLPLSLTESALAKAKAMGLGEKKWVFTLSKSSLIPFLTFSDNRALREKLYRAYLQRGSNGNEYDNRQIIQDIIRLRTEKAHLMDYPSYAAFVLDDRMAQTPERVYGLLDQLWKPALALAQEELEQIRAIKVQEGADSTFASWDWWYYAEKLRATKYNLEESSLSSYLSLDNVKLGIFQLANRLWGITFRPVSVPMYNKACTVYEVLDKSNTHLGVLNMDLFARDSKWGGAWCGSFREEYYQADGQRVAPIVTVVCNFAQSADSDPTLLTLDETETLFHEFGHALHALFSQVKYAGVGEVERDFVEFPSQLMENWATEPEVLRFYAKHITSGDAIPEYLIQNIQKSRLFNQGFQTTELLAAAFLDMDIHSIENYDPSLNSAAWEDSLRVKRGLIAPIEPRYRYPYFSHIFNWDYAAGYYSYLWAEVLEQDAYQQFVESGDVLNKEIAAVLRKQILERGGAQDGMTLYKNFRGAEPDKAPMMIKRGLLQPPPEIPVDSVVEVSAPLTKRPGYN